MRILFACALLLATAACVAPPPARASGAANAQAAQAAAYQPARETWIDLLLHRAAPGRLTLSNYSFDSARVQVVVTAGPHCAVPRGAATSEFTLPLNGTRVIAPPPGANVCWRRALAPAPHGARAAGWTQWNRAFTAAGGMIDARL